MFCPGCGRYFAAVAGQVGCAECWAALPEQQRRRVTDALLNRDADLFDQAVRDVLLGWRTQPAG